MNNYRFRAVLVRTVDGSGLVCLMSWPLMSGEVIIDVFAEKTTRVCEAEGKVRQG